jgi:site-specific DNA recombinase
MSRLVAYCRVSTELQKDNTSLKDQQRRIAAYCEATGHTLVHLFEESESASGKFRPQLTRALELVHSEEADGIIVLKLDRLARSTVEGLQIAAELKRQQKELVIVELHLDTSTAAGQCIFTVLLAFAELERNTIRERTAAGKESILRVNGYAHGRPPFGWTAINKQLVPNVEEQRILRLIFQMRADGLGYKRIAAELNRKGIPAKSRGKKWGYSAVRLILTRTQYKLAHLMGSSSS